MPAQLLADSGEITVGRTNARFIYGAWEVKLPKGSEQAEQDERLDEGYLYIPDRPRAGRSDFACTRADAVVDATAGLLKGFSNVQENISEASKKAGGAVFFEKSIADEGLTRYIPGEDFEVGDPVHVRLWGKKIETHVTSIEMVTNRANHLGWKVNIGGSMLFDLDGLRVSNRSRLAAIEADRAKTHKQASRTAARASSAVSAAVRATESAATAITDAEKAIAQAEAADLTSKEGQAKAIVALTTASRALAVSDAAQNTAIKAATDTANTAKELAETNKKVLALHAMAIDAIDHAKVRTVSADREQSSTSDDGLLTVTNPKLSSQCIIEANGDWEGMVFFIIGYNANFSYIRTKRVTKTERRWHEGRLTGSIENTIAIFWKTGESNA